jgi:hypothetical protein
MEISIQKSNQLKVIAIMMMLFLHLFNRDYKGLFTPLIFFGQKPVSFYISLFCDACVPIFAFVSGYGLYFKFSTQPKKYFIANIKRVKKLFINFWIILLLFVVLPGCLLQKQGCLGDFSTFLQNFTALNTTYNGAWWFLTIYFFFIFTSKPLFLLFQKYNAYVVFFIFLNLYIIGFYFRIYKTPNYNIELLNWFHKNSALYFATLFQFMMGVFAYQYKWSTKFANFVFNFKFKNILLIISILILIIFHALLPNLFFAAFTGLVFIFIFNSIDLPLFVSKSINFFIPHSTNIWLIHMFFSSIYFNDFIYSPIYVIPIFLLLLFCSVMSSFIVNKINIFILQKINLI